MGGVNSDLFSYYRMLVTRGFLEARAHVDEFVVLCAVHQHTSHMPCFSGPTGATAINAMRDRFAMHLQSESEVEKFVDQLIDTSIDNWRTVRNHNEHGPLAERQQLPALDQLTHVPSFLWPLPAEEIRSFSETRQRHLVRSTLQRSPL